MTPKTINALRSSSGKSSTAAALSISYQNNGLLRFVFKSDVVEVGSYNPVPQPRIAYHVGQQYARRSGCFLGDSGRQ